MIEHKLKLDIVQRGTHILPVSEWNNDRPGPAECVAEALAQLEYEIDQFIQAGGGINNVPAYRKAQQALQGLNLALNAASKQDWKLKLAQDVKADTKCCPICERALDEKTELLMVVAHKDWWVTHHYIEDPNGEVSIRGYGGVLRKYRSNCTQADMFNVLWR